MALVHVIFLYFFVAKLLKHSHAADAQHNLLAQPVFMVVAVKLVCYAPIEFAVFFNVCIKKYYWYCVISYACHIILPCRDFDTFTFYLDFYPVF